MRTLLSPSVPLVFFAGMLICGCSSPSPKVQPTSVAISDFNRWQSADGHVAFLSWNGTWMGTDCDSSLKFLPNGYVEMTEYGYAVFQYKGTYQLGSDGTIVLNLSEYKGDWPVMMLAKDSKSLLLRPKDPKQGFVMGSRGGTTVKGDEQSYWPFRNVAKLPGGS